MEWLISGGILLGSITMLVIAGELLVTGLLQLSRYLRVKEFLVAFTVMAFAASVPNLFVGVTSALKGVPDLSFGDIMGNNMAALTLGVALAVLFSAGRAIVLDSASVRKTTLVTMMAATLPIIMLVDGELSRADGVILIVAFIAYVLWLFTQDDHFSKPYEAESKSVPQTRESAFKELWKVLIGMTLLALSAQGIVMAATQFAEVFSLPLVFMGLVVLGLSGALPELYFAVISARRGEAGIVIGNLMGAVIVPSTLVLGIVAVIAPIQTASMELPLIARMFLVAAAVLFFWFARTGHRITKGEALVMFALYAVFIITLVVMV